MVSRDRVIFVMLIGMLALAAFAGGVLALGGSADQRGRPAAIGSSGPGDLLDSTKDGFVNRASGVYAAQIGLNAAYSGSPEQVALAFLRDKSGDYGLSRSGSDLLLDAVQDAPGSKHVRFHQSIGGVPVYRAEMVVSLSAEGSEVHAVSSSYDPILAHASIATAPALTSERARELAMNAVGIAADARWLGDPKSDLMIVRDQDRVGATAHLAWRVTLPVEQPMGDWEVFVDAQNGSIIRLSDQMLNVDGQGYTWNPDPLTTAEVFYGGTWVDNNDNTNAGFDAQRFLMSLRDITLVSGNYNLRGLWAYSDDFETPTIAPPTSPNLNGFMFNRFDDGFEWVNAYYDIDTSQRYIQSLGFNNIQHGPLHFDAHGLQGQDNSHYIPSSNKIAYGDGGVDDAEDADVVLHEYGHAIQSSIVPGWGGGQEGSMGEGFGDYWACSHSKDLSHFHADSVFNWDGHNPYWAGRMVNGTLTYQNINGDIYHDGDIWASCWWLVWPECGRAVTDTDMLKLHFYMTSTGTMAQAAAFAMQADHDLFGGLHSGSLNYYFVQRRFLTAGQFDVPVLTHTPLPNQSTGGPYPLTVTISSVSGIVANSVKVKFGTGTTFNQEVVLNPTGNPGEWGGAIPGQGGNVDFKYYIIADNSAGWRGASPRGAEFTHYTFHVDNLVGVDATGASLALALHSASPSPFNERTSIRFDLPSTSSARITIHDLTGRTVRTLVNGTLIAGTHAYSWDGNDDAGHAMASGLYFVRLNADGRELSRKVLLTR
jgi:zinc metalloprotease ZmpB